MLKACTGLCLWCSILNERVVVVSLATTLEPFQQLLLIAFDKQKVGVDLSNERERRENGAKIMC